MKTSNSRMQADFSPGNQRHEILEEEWYMNKLSGSGLTKILKSPIERNGKVRSMENILADPEDARRNQTELEHSQHSWDEYEDLSCVDQETKTKTHATLNDIEDSLPVKNNAINGNTECETQSIFSRQAWIPLCASNGNDIDVEKMTIRQMHQLLKKAARKSSKSQRPSSLLPSDGSTASARCEDCPRDSEQSLTSDNAVPMGALELHLDSSTSNSTDSSDDTGGVGSSYNKPEILNYEGNIVASKVDEAAGFTSKKRKDSCWMDSAVAGALLKVEADQDEWTLGMWQSYHKQHSRHKKSKMDTRSHRPSESIPKQSTTGVPLTCTEPIAICSFNSTPVFDQESGSKTPFQTFPSRRPLQDYVGFQDSSKIEPIVICSFKPTQVLDQESGSKTPFQTFPSRRPLQDSVGFQDSSKIEPIVICSFNSTPVFDQDSGSKTPFQTFPSRRPLQDNVEFQDSSKIEPIVICSFNSTPVFDQDSGSKTPFQTFPSRHPLQDNVGFQDSSKIDAKDLRNDKALAGRNFCNNKLPLDAIRHESVPSNCVVQEDMGCRNIEAEDLSNGKPPNEDLYCRGLFLDQISNVKLDKNQDVQDLESSRARESVRLVLEDESEILVSKPSSPVKQFMKTIDWALKPCTRNPLCTTSDAATQILPKRIGDGESMEACDVSDSKKNDFAITLPIESKVGAERNENILTDAGAAVSRLSGSVRVSSDYATEFIKDMSSSSEKSSHHEAHQKKGMSLRRSDNTDETCYGTEFSLSDSMEKVKAKSSELPLSELAAETFDVEEERNGGQHKPAKLPCKRNAISPLSREKLLQASNFRECGFNDQENQSRFRGSKRLSPSFKGYIRQDGFNRDGIDMAIRKRGVCGELSNGVSSPSENFGQKGEAPLGSPSYNKDLSHIWQKPQPAKPPPSSANCIPAAAVPSEYTPSHAKKLSLVLNNSPSPSPQQSSKVSVIENGSSPVGFSPVIPTKGILRSSSQVCQGACRCEECVSVRSRAEKASTFSQRQMQDIEGLAVKLMKELGTMRTIVEEGVLQGSRSQGPRSTLSLEQVKSATSSALETEETAKKWLVRMARDCNRYCKIMRMQQRRLSFADESGGQLCQIKVFQSSFATTETQNGLPRSLSVDSSIFSKDDDLSVEVTNVEAE